MALTLDRCWRAARALRAAILAPGFHTTAPAARQGAPPDGRREVVAVGISGGVDSAVAAMLLKQQGHEVVGVFMQNWDEREEVGNQNCSVERDRADAAAVCRALGIPLHQADFVAQYWNSVFTEFVSECGRGLTPNPDLPCNRNIKFASFLDHAQALGADRVATGHYARIVPPAGAGSSGSSSRTGGSCSWGSSGAASRTSGSSFGSAAGAPSPHPLLLRGVDRSKDQSYFLASVAPEALARALFPLGSLQKGEVRNLAAEAGLPTAAKRSSAGICFIGRRNFGEFMEQYVPPLPGRYSDVDTGQDLGPCPNMLAVTHGQRPGIGGAPARVYVAGKDMVRRVVYVARGGGHPALRTRTALLRAPHWLSPAHAARLEAEGWLACQYKARYGQDPLPCTLHALSPRLVDGAVELRGCGGGFWPSAHSVLHPPDMAVLPGYLVASFPEPAAALTPQQAFVMYDGEVCLGSALIAVPGRSLHEEGIGGAAVHGLHGG